MSGAESASIKFVLEQRLGLKKPPVIAMNDAPQKPDPTGLLSLADELFQNKFENNLPTIGYLGDTVADVLTVNNAKRKRPSQKFISFAVAPPHLHNEENKSQRLLYELTLKEAGADIILSHTNEIVNYYPESVFLD